MSVKIHEFSSGGMSPDNRSRMPEQLSACRHRRVTFIVHMTQWFTVFRPFSAADERMVSAWRA
ncbi:hypothetical protein AB5J52_49640 (plasmid) [Streptomyces sp. R39]|uniref:Uncharacterized protein n=1 Tax=Streptomyces sp. R39 TaxID=3238631 RepID=A0AB39RAZ3_9ACTN